MNICKQLMCGISLSSIMALSFAMPIVESSTASKLPSTLNKKSTESVSLQRYKPILEKKQKTESSITKTTYNSHKNKVVYSSFSTTKTVESSEITTKKTVVDPDKVVLNFENADIQTVIKAISVLSGKNFVIDPRVKGTVNIVSDKPVSKAESYKVLESALRMQGFASIEADGVIKVLPEADAKTYGMKMEDSRGSQIQQKHQLGDQIITKVFVIQHGSATALVNALRPLVAPNNSINAYPNSNAIVVSDYSSNVKRIGKIIAQLTATDEGVAAKPIIVELHNAIASDVAGILNSYTSGGGSSSSGRSSFRGGTGNSDVPNSTITVDPNTNALIIYSPIKSTEDELVNLAQKIDSETKTNQSNLHVVYLRNGDAAHIAEILRDVMKNQEDPDIKASSDLAHFATEPTSAFSTSSGSSGGATGGAPTPSPSSSMKPVTSNKAPGSTSNKPDQPQVIIQADPSTNALIIQAPLAVYRNIRMIIDMLDIRRAQVFIEAMIADINQTQEGSFGIQWLTGAGNQNLGVVGLGNYGGTSSAGNSSLGNLVQQGVTVAQAGAGGAGAAGAGAAAALAGGAAGGASGGGISIPNEMYIGLVTGTVSVGGQTIPGLSGLADMIEANSAGNILSRPTLITMDNEEARIMVGSNIGIPNGSISSAGAFPGTAATTVSRQDLGTILQIKPLITQNGSIQMDVYQEDSSVDPSTLNSPNGPTFLERKLRTTLLVDDGQIIALGGMTEDSITIEQYGIPGLSEIPYLGWLFSWQHRKHIKSNLVLFLRPVIIKNAEGYRALTNQRYNYVIDRQNQIQAKGNAMLPGINAINLDNQLPYDYRISPQNNPALNLNKNLPIVDMTNHGKNFDKIKATGAVNTSTTVVKALGQNATPNN